VEDKEEIKKSTWPCEAWMEIDIAVVVGLFLSAGQDAGPICIFAYLEHSPLSS
jgi:hypothetical protein